MSKSSFTVYFDAPFWVGVYERIEDNTLTVCKVTFGSEPKDYEVYRFLLDNWDKLKFSPPVKTTDAGVSAPANPKRMQRAISRQLQQCGVGTKAQQAIKQAQAAGKQARKAKSRIQKEQEQERRFALRTQKRKEKHKGH